MCFHGLKESRQRRNASTLGAIEIRKNNSWCVLTGLPVQQNHRIPTENILQ